MLRDLIDGGVPRQGLLPDEDPDLRREILRTIGEEWLNAKNLWLEGRSPNDLIGTRDEFQVGATSSGRLRPPRCREFGGLREAATNPGKRCLVSPHFAGTSPDSVEQRPHQEGPLAFQCGITVGPRRPICRPVLCGGPYRGAIRSGSSLR